MEKEFNLSKKIRAARVCAGKHKVIETCYIKIFIKRLKENIEVDTDFCADDNYKAIFFEIDKLAGDKLANVNKPITEIDHDWLGTSVRDKDGKLAGGKLK